MHPILFYITDSFYISTYGVMVVLGMAAGLGLAGWRAQKTGFGVDLVIDVAIVGVLAGFLGGRVVFILTNFGDFLHNPGQYIFSRSGFVFLGGLIGGVVTAWWMLRRRIPQTMWAFGDVVAPALPLGHAFGRLGCWFTGCCHGSICDTSNPLGVRFPLVFDRQGEAIGSMAFLTQWDKGLLPQGATQSLPVWPTQLFSSGANVLICLVLLWFFRRRKFDGQVILLYGFLYSVARFVIEYFRGDAERGVYFGGFISTSQLIVLLGLPFLAALWWNLSRRGLTQLPVELPAEKTEDDKDRKNKSKKMKRKR